MRRNDHSHSNALAWFSTIVEMVDAMRSPQADESGHYTRDGVTFVTADDLREDAERVIHESVLSVEVRSGWVSPREPLIERRQYGPDKPNPVWAPAEYRILLTTGGPALQLTGELNEHGEPETAELQFQDWGTPWTVLKRSDYPNTIASETVAAYLLDFARQFYFGEG